MIDTYVLEDILTTLVNGVRSMDNNGPLVRVSSLDELARTHSGLMADRGQLYTEPIDLDCGTSATQVVRSPQVKSFRYRGAKEAPSSTTPTKYDRTSEEAAADVVEYMQRGKSWYARESRFKYVGVGVSQRPDELGFMDFWVTLYLTDCVDEALTEDTTATTLTPSPTSIPAARATPNVGSSPLGGFQNGRWLEQRDPKLASAIEELGWVEDGIDDAESEVLEDLLYIAVSSRPLVSSIVALGWVQDRIDRDEAAAIEQLSYLATRDAGAAMRIVGMPFVETIEPPDISAIKSLRLLAAYNPETLVEILTHPLPASGHFGRIGTCYRYVTWSR